MAPPSIELSTVVVAADDHLTANLDDEAVVLGLERGLYFGLNEVGASIWELLRSPRRVDEIRDAIVDGYDVDRARATADVLSLLRKMAAEGMIEVRD